MLTLRPDVDITGIDWRACTGPGHLIRGDVLVQTFPPETFDAIVGISSIEHIGLGHYEADPLDVDGDRHAMERAAGWLKPGGWIYADVPYGPEYRVDGTSHRIYNETALQARLCPPGCRIVQTWFTDGDGLVSKDRLISGRFPFVAVLMRKD